MENKQVLHSSKIKNLITKFYYKQNHLCFQILLNCENGETKVYKEFIDYAEYKAEYNRLLEVKAADEFVLMQENEVNPTHMSYI